MKGILKSIKLRNVKTKDNKNFDVIDYVVDVVTDEAKQEVKTYKGNMSVEYAKKYFAFANTRTSDQIGKEVGVVLAKRMYEKDGEQRTITYIKYLNLLDEDGKAIIMNKKEGDEALDF